MMQFAHSYLAKTEGLQFYKLLGTGRGAGFNPFPDWSVYALLQVWNSGESAEKFFTDSDLYAKYQSNSQEQWTLYMKSIIAKGFWSEKEPFESSKELDDDNPLLAIITRATIKASKLITFWRYVPTSEKPLNGNDGLLYKKGIGEAPIFQMATFSLWKDEDSLKKFAYQSREHRLAIEKTRDLNWYSEELFSRFQPYKSVGTWEGKNPLPELEH